MCARLPVDRAVDRTPYRPTFGRLKAPMFLFVTVDRAVDRGLATVIIFEKPVDRPVDRELDFSLNG